jgi:hypothetical protein
LEILKSKKLTSVEELGQFKLRELDEIECNLSGLTGREAVASSIQNSDESFSVWVGNDLFAMWGYKWRSYLSGGADLWLLTTPMVDKNRKTFVKECCRLVPLLKECFGLVVFDGWPGHAKAMRLLKKFEFSKAYGTQMILYAFKESENHGA